MLELEESLSDSFPVKSIQPVFNELNFDPNLLCLEDIFNSNIKSFFEDWLLNKIVPNREGHGGAKQKGQHLLLERSDMQWLHLDHA